MAEGDRGKRLIEQMNKGCQRFPYPTSTNHKREYYSIFYRAMQPMPIYKPLRKPRGVRKKSLFFFGNIIFLYYNLGHTEACSLSRRFRQ